MQAAAITFSVPLTYALMNSTALSLHSFHALPGKEESKECCREGLNAGVRRGRAPAPEGRGEAVGMPRGCSSSAGKRG